MSRFLLLQTFRNVSTSAINAAKKPVTSGGIRSTPNNPGINLRLRAIQQAENGLPLHLEEGLDDLESDLMNVDEVYGDHEREIKMQKHARDMNIVERKYFKNAKEPNMVFWEEKEQMRYLHNNNPDEWDVARLAESFPVSQAGVKKILKANWNPQAREKMMKYNESVRRNWKMLEEGTLDVKKNLKMHLMKFASRKQAQLPSSDLLLAQNSNTVPVKQLHNGVGNTVETRRHKLKKCIEETEQQQEKNFEKNVKNTLPGMYRIRDKHYDDDGEFLFRVPGMNS